MLISKLCYQEIKKKYLDFIKSQQVLSEPFRDKVSQLNPEQTLVLIKASRCYALDSLVDQLLERAK